MIKYRKPFWIIICIAYVALIASVMAAILSM